MRIELLGTSFTIQTDQDPEYLARLIEYVRGKAAEVSASVTTTEPLKLSILSSILLADELFKAQEFGSAPRGDAEAEQIATRILRLLDDTLSESDDSADE